MLDATNGPCLVLGSAPDPVLPAGHAVHWTFVSVNASQAGAAKAGIQRIPDLTVMSGQMLGIKPENLAGQEALRDGCTTQLLLVERGVSARQARPALRALNYRYGALRTMDHWQRASLTYRLLGEHLATGSGESKISTGVFAALLAASLGYGPIVMCGFSLSHDGHSYNPLGHRRQHREVDAHALRMFGEKRLAVFTSDPAFAKSSGLPLWDGSHRPTVRSGPIWSDPSPSLQT
ncbi:hypothetical protein B1810_09970 [Panacagrimonas perspica]|uniref:hypothetical protein n=1 Tax=Panacagrimonas perspica TaxID=381431 RepID=UPI00113C4D31|nr:hypothetical protein [Panacagrimonas perspica]THD02932.1 hypothetical protein B1810_09970 [Panacagrimonas perspica]